jgi:predicted CopG family antitoxin
MYNIFRRFYVSEPRDDQTFKTIKIKKDVWRDLNYLKLEEEAKTISNIISKLIEYYKRSK